MTSPMRILRVAQKLYPDVTGGAPCHACHERVTRRRWDPT